MRINEYDSLEDFIYEYSQGKEFSWQNIEHKERFMGIEFLFRGVYYRMCREPFDEKLTPILENGKPGLYDVMIINCRKYGYPQVDSYELVGWYTDLNDVLENCMIEGEPFKRIIMDDFTEILGKD